MAVALVIPYPFMYIMLSLELGQECCTYCSMH